MKKILILPPVCFLILIISSYGSAKETIKIGLITPLTGDVKTIYFQGMLYRPIPGYGGSKFCSKGIKNKNCCGSI